MSKQVERQGDLSNELSRADFLKRTAAAGLGLAAFGALTACSTDGSATGDAVTWDKEVDVLVVGSGTVAWAGLAAIDAGAASVLVIEKTQTWGGTSALSGGGMAIPLSYLETEAGIEDNRDDVIAYYTAASQNRGNSELIAAYVDNGNLFLEWTRDKLGWKWVLPPVPMFQDYYEPLAGFRAFGRGNISPVFDDPNLSSGPGAWQTLQTQLTEKGAEILLSTAAKSLVKDATGAVTGVVATAEDGSEIRIHALKGVILGTGGFDHNAEMRKAYLTTPIMATVACLGNTGDARRMGMEIGAALGTMTGSWGLPFLANTTVTAPAMLPEEIIYDFAGFDWGGYRCQPGAVVVNRYGQRIGDEGSMYAVFNRAFEQYDTSAKDYRNLPAYFICDSMFTTYYTLPGGKAPGEIPEWMVSANTLEELADKLGIDKAGLSAEMAAIIANAANGVDPVWHRGEYSIDQTAANMFSLYGLTRPDLKNAALAPVATGPFYGGSYVPGSFGTCGGLKIDANAQVVHVNGEPIPGLYAVGNCAMSVSGGAYAAGGMTVGSGSVMAWVAARHAMGARQ